jgi:hypothetical protein
LCFVFKLPPGFGEGYVGYGFSETVAFPCAHSFYVQVFNDDYVVVFDDTGRELVNEVGALARYFGVQTGESFTRFRLITATRLFP